MADGGEWPSPPASQGRCIECGEEQQALSLVQARAEVHMASGSRSSRHEAVRRRLDESDIEPEEEEGQEDLPGAENMTECGQEEPPFESTAASSSGGPTQTKKERAAWRQW